MSVWIYKLGHDWGFAPNPFFGTCTLACCKSNIRVGAKVGDFVFGVGGDESKRPGRAIFWMRVDRIMRMDDYYQAPEFQKKKASPNGTLKRYVGDNIYHKNSVTGLYLQDESFHAPAGGALNAETLRSDTGANGHRDKMLIGYEFTYWGGDGPQVPEHLSRFICENRDREKRTDPSEIAAFLDWARQAPRGLMGLPTEWSYHDPKFFRKRNQLSKAA